MGSVVQKSNGRRVRIGFVALIDAATIIAAYELGYFAEEGLDVHLSREVGWANVRDKLAFHRLDASQSLIGHPIRSALQMGHLGGAISAVMSLGTGGDAITLSRRLTSAGVTTAASLLQYIRQFRASTPLVFAHVSESSVHHYLLRDWLAHGGIDPDRDVRLCVLPPPQMPAHLADRQIDGFCAGEPWNSIAHLAGNGDIAALTSDIVPAHPDKVLAVNQNWASHEPQTVESIFRAIIRGSRFCADPKNLPALAAMLSGARYLDIDPRTIRQSLELDRNHGGPNRRLAPRTLDWAMRSFDATFPNQTHAAWMTWQMIRWNHVPATVDPWSIAAECMNSTAYRAAAAALDVDCPATETPPMKLNGGKIFDRNSTQPAPAAQNRKTPSKPPALKAPRTVIVE